MSIPLTRLYDETNNPYELKLLAGADGLSREVSWVQVMEDSDYASFLLRDELLFTTGMGCKEQENWLHDFIVALMEAGSAGVVINVGKYILREDIMDDILDLCNTHHFPLFIMPWKIRLADVTQSFLYALFLTKQEEYELIEACKELLYTTGNEEKALQTLTVHGFPKEAMYQVIAIHDENVSDARLTTYKGCLNELGVSYILFPAKTGYVLVCYIYHETAVHSLCQTLPSAPTLQGITLGCGMTVESLLAVRRCYTQALQAVVWARREGKNVAQFQQLGVYSILFSQENEEAMKHLHDTVLGPLLTYDMTHHRNLYATLQSYLRHDGSIRAVAAETFVHRNTVSYRMQKIKQLVHNDLQDSESRFTFMLACHIHAYLALKEEWASYLP